MGLGFIEVARVWGLNFEEFLAGFWRKSGGFLAKVWGVLTERKRVSTEIRDGHALEAFRLLGRHALVTFQAVLDQLVEGSRSGHPEEVFGLLRRHTLVTFRAVLVRLWGSEASCPKGAASSLQQEARRDHSVPWKPRAQKVPPFLFRKRPKCALKASCPKGAALSLPQEVRRDQNVPRAGGQVGTRRQCSSARGTHVL